MIQKGTDPNCIIYKKGDADLTEPPFMILR